MIDSVQRSFLKSIGVTEKYAFLEMNLAPLQLRRDLSMLGALHKCAWGTAHKDMLKLFPLHKYPMHPDGPFWKSNVHDRQLHDFCNWKSVRPWQLWMKRSAYGLVGVYNDLPQSVVNMEKVSLFQKTLQNTAKELCRNDFPDWEFVFSPKV